MKITLQSNSLGLLQKAKRADKKLAYAAVNAINNTAKKLQKLERDHAEKEFNVRKEFTKRQVAIIKPFASVGKNIPYAELSVGQKDRFLLSEFEAGGERKPFTPGAKRVAVPLIDGKVRGRFPGSFPKELYFKALNLKPRQPKNFQGPRDPNKQVIWRGRHRTYMIPSIGVFQRRGIGRGNTKPIFLFDDDVPIEKRLEFVKIASEDGGALLTDEMEAQIIKEIGRGL